MDTVVRIVKRGGLVFEAHRLLFHSTLGSRVIKKKKKGTVVAATRPAVSDEEHFLSNLDIERICGIYQTCKTTF